MSIQHLAKCEMCGKTHEIQLRSLWKSLPSEWFVLYGNDVEDGWHFCSDKCLVQWTTGNVVQEQSNKPPCKMRRFVLVHRDENVEGVIWDNGFVSLNPGSDHIYNHCGDYYFPTWEAFIEVHPIDHVTWIDQEP